MRFRLTSEGVTSLEDLTVTPVRIEPASSNCRILIMQNLGQRQKDVFQQLKIVSPFLTFMGELGILIRDTKCVCLSLSRPQLLQTFQ